MALIVGSNGNNVLNGTNGGDIILAGGGNDTVNGGAGTDIIDGGSGNDVLNGGLGDDLVTGGSGNDTIDGGAGDDILDGGDGNDTINGGAGCDLLVGGSGNDTLNSGSGSDIIEAGSGNDLVIHVGSENAGTLNVYDGGQGRDTLRLVVSASLAQSSAFQAELAAFKAQLAHGTAYFASLGIIAKSFETVEVVTEAGGNAAPTDIALSNGSVAENSGAGTVVGQLSATDPNAGDSHSFTIIGGRSDLFEVAGTTLRVKAGAVLDHEAAASHQVTIRVTDAGGLTRDESFTIGVTNVNETPSDIALVGASAQENAAAGTVVGALSATDPDAAGASSFTLLDNAGGRFAINGNQIVVAGSLDYEGAASHQVVVKVTDTGGLSHQESFTIGVTNVNEAPTGIALAGTTAQENAAAGTVVGTLSASDPDAAGASSFTLLDNAGGRFAINGNQLVVAGGLDHETNSSHQVTVNVTDGGGLTHQETFTISVGDVNEAPTQINLSSAVVAENAAGAEIGSLTVVDPDAGDSATLSVDDSRFEIVDGKLKLKDGISLDRESEPEVVVNVTATDAGDLVKQQAFTIAVGNVNEAPASISLSSASVNENASGVAIGAISVTDPDAGDTVTFTVDDDRFEVSGGQLRLKTGVALDADTDAGTEVQIVVTATDSGNLSVNQVFTITINNADDGFGLDGYIAGATVFADANGNGVLDIDTNTGQLEVNTVTDAYGFFSLFGGTGPIVMVGGPGAVDISTGLEFNGMMRAPAGSTVVTPLTTLVVALAETVPGMTVEQANDQVLLGLGLSEDIDLASFDPVAATLSSDGTVQDQGQAAMAAAIQVQNTIVQAASLLTGAGASAADATAAVIGQLAQLINSVEPPPEGEEIQAVLNDPALISAVITTAASEAGADQQKVADTAAQAASVITVSNTVVSTAASNQGGVELLETLAQAAAVAQGQAATELATAGSDGTTAGISQSLQTTTGVTGVMATVTPLNVVGANAGLILSGTSGADTLQGFAGDDELNGLGGNDILIGADGNDALDGGDGIDRAVYGQASGAVQIDLAAGTASGAGAGNDTLTSIETVRGSSFADTYTAAGFGASSPNAGSISFQNVDGRFNEFEGGGGNDSITGNGATRISYLSATAGVTVNLTAGTATGDASVGSDSFTGVNGVRGSNFADQLTGSNNQTGVENFEGRGGDDTIDGDGGFDRAIYGSEASGIAVNLAAGTVTGGGGNDTLDSIEAIRGTELADTFTAVGFTTSSANAGSAGSNPATGAAFNEFEGLGGNDTITGNGNTRIVFYNATDDVTVDLAAGTATGNASVGNDTFTGVVAVAGSYFDDILLGSNLAGTTETFDGRGGNDFINGRGGFDLVVYNSDTSITSGISVDMALGTVTGTGVGTDTLIAVELVRGTNMADTFVATGFAGASTDTGMAATFNDFEGLGGNDVITGNGDTRINFSTATGGVTVDLAAGTASGNTSVGTDTFTGVSRARGSNGNDTISGNDGNNVLEGQGGSDTINGRGGNDVLTGGVGGDTFVVGDDADSIMDFNRLQGDKIDLTGVPGIFNLAQLQAVAFPSGGSHTFINFGNGNTLFLANVTVGSLQASDFIFAANTAAPTDILLSANVALENSFPGAVIGSLSAIDADAGDTATFTLLDDAGGLFRIDGNALAVNGPLNYEATTSYQVTVRATDLAGQTYDKIFTVNIANQNENPSQILLSANTIPENAGVGAVVGALSAIDPDPGDSASFELLDNAGGLFAISGSNLVVNGVLDADAGPYHVIVRVTDAGGLTHDQPKSIFVTQNVAPLGIGISSNVVAENASVGTVIGLLSAVDPDFGDTFTFSLLDNVGGRFALDGANLVVAGALDHESLALPQVGVRVTDSAGNSFDGTIIVNVTNVNEAPSDVALVSPPVAENSAAGTVVGFLSATDLDPGDTVTYSLVDDAGGSFDIDGTNLVVAGALDYEAGASRSVTVRVTDAGGLTRDETFTIALANQNEAPTDILLAGDTVPEASALGTVVGSLSVVDPDAGDTATFTLIDSAGGRFAISGSNLVVAGTLDYETAPSHQVTVRVSDAGGFTRDEIFTISVTNVGGNVAPTDIALSGNSVIENSPPGTVVGTLSATDPNAGDSATFTLLDNAGGRFALSGSDLVVAGALDFEAAGSHQVTVRVTDGGGNTYDETLLITVVNQNEAPTDIALTGSTIVENNAPGAVIGVLSTTDPDAGDSATYTLVDNAGGRFAISGSNLVAAGALDFEAGSFHQVTVRVTDGGGNTYDEIFPVTIGNQNEAPTDIVLTGSTVAENSGPGTIVGTIATVDPDFADGATLSLVDDAGGRFSVFGTLLMVAGPLDHEAAGSHQVTVRVTDTGGLFYDETVTVTVTNQNEAPTDIVLTGDTVAENSAAGTVVGTLSAVDPDAGDTATFMLIDSAGGRFALSGSDLVVAGALDYESFASHQINVQVTDQNGVSRNEFFMINVANLNGSTVTGDETNNTLVGDSENDVLQGLGGDDNLQGFGHNDTLQGGDGFDRAIYIDATGGVNIDMAAGTANGSGVGNDTLHSIEMVRGSNFIDNYMAGSYGLGSANAPSVSFQNADGRFNEFEGMGGNDIITSNGATRASYLSATGAVTVNLQTGTAFSTGANDAASIGTDTLIGVGSVRGSNFNDTLIGGNGNENFEGRGGDDSISGGGGFDRAVYSFETAAITVNLAAGTVTGGGGSDTLSSVEGIRGTNSADTINAAGFTTGSPNAGNAGTILGNVAFNEIEGMGGNDQITGNGNTRLAFYNAANGVTVDLLAGTASGDASVGSDTVSGINAIAGSWFDDTFFGTANGSAVPETFDGRNGNDTINGRGGFDIAVYNNDSSVTAGISVDMAAGTVTGGVGVGNDTLIEIESVRGTNSADTYVATGYAGSSTDFGLPASFNEFEGLGGNDTITGNGSTRISYISANAGVVVDMVNGTASGNASVGSDTFTGVSRVRGSNLNDTITGNADNNIIEGRGGADNLTGGGGADTFTFVNVGINGDSTAAAQDIIQDFLEGTDILNLSQIDANTALAGDNAFLFVAAETSAVQANSITWSYSGGNTIVRADNNGDTTADLTFTLTGLKALTATDFLL